MVVGMSEAYGSFENDVATAETRAPVSRSGLKHLKTTLRLNCDLARFARECIDFFTLSSQSCSKSERSLTQRLRALDHEMVSVV